MFGIFKRKLQPQPAAAVPNVGLVGHEVHVNVNPTRAAARNEARIERLKQAIAQSQNPTKKAELEAELALRTRR